MKRRSTFGWLDLLIGILFVVLGILTLVYPPMALSWLIILLGIAAIASGISDIVLYAKLRKNTGLEANITLVTGIISALAGLILILNPLIGRWILNIVFPIWFIARCISRLVGYDYIKQTAGKGAAIAMLCLNILGLLFGILMVFNSAIFTMSMGILVGITLIILGISSIIEAFSDMGASDEA